METRTKIINLEKELNNENEVLYNVDFIKNEKDIEKF